MKRTLIAATLALVASGAWAQNDNIIFGRSSVIDGDTIEIRGERIRLGGIDAPEAGQNCKDDAGKAYPCGRRAAAALDELLGDYGGVSCFVSRKDQYGRSIAECHIGQVNVNAWMVTAGWAIAYRRYGGEKYATHEASAKAAKRGIWQGEFQEPDQFRRAQR